MDEGFKHVYNLFRRSDSLKTVLQFRITQQNEAISASDEEYIRSEKKN